MGASMIEVAASDQEEWDIINVYNAYLEALRLDMALTGEGWTQLKHFIKQCLF